MCKSGRFLQSQSHIYLQLCNNDHSYIFLDTIVASNVLHKFEEAFAGEIINPCDLIIKEQIGEGEYF